MDVYSHMHMMKNMYENMYDRQLHMDCWVTDELMDLQMYGATCKLHRQSTVRTYLQRRADTR